MANRYGQNPYTRGRSYGGPGSYSPRGNRPPPRRRFRVNVFNAVLVAVLVVAAVVVGACFLSRGNSPRAGGPGASAAALPTGTAAATPQESATPGESIEATATPDDSSGTSPSDASGFFTNGDVQVDTTNMVYKSADLYVKVTNYNDNNGQNYYVADCRMKDSNRLFTAFATNQYAPHHEDKTSTMAQSHGAVIAVNGDYYGAAAADRADRGIVIRNGQLYRSKLWYDVAAVFNDGTMKTYDKSEITADQLMSQGCVQAWNFGPMLLDKDGKVFPQDQLKKREPLNNPANPRTGIGYIEPNHFVLVVVDGTRTAGSGYKGMTRLQFAQLFESLGCKCAYNLDGGGSSAMVFMGKVISHPCDPNSGERSVSDIVYFGESATDQATIDRFNQ